MSDLLQELGIEVYEVAEKIFTDLGFADDFCHQTGLVFGGTNRIKLTSKGWVADKSYCTPNFLAKFQNYNQSVDWCDDFWHKSESASLKCPKCAKTWKVGPVQYVETIK